MMLFCYLYLEAIFFLKNYYYINNLDFVASTYSSLHIYSILPLPYGKLSACLVSTQKMDIKRVSQLQVN